MATPSTPDWKFGYVPSAGEWANAFAGKADYPVPVGQGGTGAQAAPDANYNLQQRAEVITATQAASAMTLYGLRTDLLAITVNLPLLATLKPGDWIELVDTGANAGTNPVTIAAAGSDQINLNGAATSSIQIANNGGRCLLIVTSAGWSASIVTQNTGIGLSAAGIRTITTTVTVDKTYVGYACKVAGAGITITLPDTGFIAGATIAFDNVDSVNSCALVTTSGDAPGVLLPGDCCILVADGAGGWWKIAYHTSNTLTTPAPQQNANTVYTLAATDVSQYLQFTSDSAVTVTVPASADVPVPFGAVVIIEQYGQGQVTLVGATGVTLNSRNGLKSAGQFAVVQLKNGSDGSADTWTVLGDVSS